MKLELAKSAGFCYGVRRAVHMAEQAAGEGSPCVMLGPIIHNSSVIDYLRERGIGLIQTPEEAQPGATVIIRSHGEGKAAYDALEKRGCQLVDTTCPNVSRIHQIVSQAEADGRQVVIIGMPTHPEVAAIAGWCAKPLVFEGADALSEWLDEDETHRSQPVTMVSQTTSTRAIWDKCVEKAKKSVQT